MVQSFSLEGILCYARVRLFNKSFAIPHFSVFDINDIDPMNLRYLGFKGVVFDKDNTLTAPYGNELFPPVKNAFMHFKSVFDERIAILSNSVGSRDDRGYNGADEIEQKIGIKVIRHARKKPGCISSVLDYFKCAPLELVSIGDRIFTDIVFGNMYGMLTFHTQALTENGDNRNAVILRRHESRLVEKWRNLGIKAPAQALLAGRELTKF